MADKICLFFNGILYKEARRALLGRWGSAAFGSTSIVAAYDGAVDVGAAFSPLMMTAAALESARARCALGGAAAQVAARSGSVIDTLRRPPLGASARRYSSSAASRSAAASSTAVAPAPAASGGRKKKMAALAAAVLVKVGDGKWRSFKHTGLLSMDASDLLQALKADGVFGDYFKGVEKVGDCSVGVHKLPSSEDEPTAEDASKFVELKGAKTIEVTAGSITAGEQLCIRVQLPGASLPTGSAAARLLETLPHAKLEPIPGEGEGGCMLLVLYDSHGAPVNWPNLDSNKLLIRPTFREFFERADMFNHGKRRMPRSEPPDSLVRGIPGIGKSSFALYCLWRLAVEEKRHVFYDYPKGLGGRERDTLEFGSGPFEKSVYIADGLKPRIKAGVSMLVSSPRQDFFGELHMDSEWFFMPEPSKPEMYLMRDYCFPELKDELTDAVMEERIERWGCVPRMVFRSSRSEQAQLRSTLEGLSVGRLRRLLLKEQQEQEAGTKKDTSFRVVR